MKKANWLYILSILILPLLVADAWPQQTAPSIECSSIPTILADPEACDKRPVRIEGKVIQFKLQTSKKGNPYTEFTLADGSKKLTFFSYNHLPLKEGICLQVEGVYYVKREVRSFIFENQVVVEKKPRGLLLYPAQKSHQQVKTLLLLLNPIFPSLMEVFGNNGSSSAWVFCFS